MSNENSLQVVVVPVTPFAQNCSLVWCTETKKAAIVDPGGDIDQVMEAVRAHGVTVEKLLVTHGHLDHAGGTADLAGELGVPIEGPHEEDLFLIESLAQQGQNYGMTHCRPFQPSRWLRDGDTVTVGAQTFSVHHCPGHTPGHVVYFHAGMKLAFVGDVLFQGSIGRTDFPRGDHPTLIRSITTKLWPLGDDVTFVPGHGPASTFGRERRSNPFVGDAAVE